MRFLLAAVSSALLFSAAPCEADAGAKATVEVAPPPPNVAADVLGLRRVAEAEVQRAGASLAARRRAVVISLAVTQTGASPVVCNVNATVRDARTGTMLAVVEGEARADASDSPEQRKAIAYAAVRTAVRQVPEALTRARR